MDQIRKLKNKLQEQSFDSLLVSNYYNILYLTGFKTLTKDEREAWVLVTNNNTYILSDGRYINNLKIPHFVPTLRRDFVRGKQNLKLLTPRRGLIYFLQEIIQKEKISTIGFEGDDLTVNELETLKNKLPTVKFISTDKVILKQREIKDQEEIKKIKKTCSIGDICLKEIIKSIKLGQTEKEIAFKIEFWLKKKGYDLAFPPLVAIDKNSAVPHYNTGSDGSNRVKRGSIVLVDFGVNYQDYLSDMTRMVFFGKPTVEQINVYNKLRSVQEKAMKQCSNVNNLKEMDKFCRLRITDYGFPVYPHSTGHGVGLEIHEYPKISQTSTDILKPNKIFTIEPGVYFPGKWGMRIEDTILINKDLQPYSLTKYPKSLLMI